MTIEEKIPKKGGKMKKMEKKDEVKVLLFLFLYVIAILTLGIVGYSWYILLLVPIVCIITKAKFSTWFLLTGIVVIVAVMLGLLWVKPLQMVCIALVVIFILYSFKRRDFFRLKKEYAFVRDSIKNLSFLARSLCQSYKFEDAVVVKLSETRKALDFVSSYTPHSNKRKWNKKEFEVWANKVIDAGGISFFSSCQISNQTSAIWLMVPMKVADRTIGVLAIKGPKLRIFQHLKMFKNLADVLSAVISK